MHLRARVIDAKPAVTHPCNDDDSSITSHSSYDSNVLLGSYTTTSLLQSSCKRITCPPPHYHSDQYATFRITSTQNPLALTCLPSRLIGNKVLQRHHSRHGTTDHGALQLFIGQATVHSTIIPLATKWEKKRSMLIIPQLCHWRHRQEHHTAISNKLSKEEKKLLSPIL